MSRPERTDIHWGVLWIALAILIGVVGYTIPALTGHPPVVESSHH